VLFTDAFYFFEQTEGVEFIDALKSGLRTCMALNVIVSGLGL